LGRGIAILACLSFLLLQGCFLPLPVRVASWALDGISYVATQKSLTDHGLTLVAKRDCAVLRMLKGQSVCMDEVEETIAIAAAGAATTADQDETAALASFETAAGGAETAIPAIADVPARKVAAGRAKTTDSLAGLLSVTPPPRKPMLAKAAARSVPASLTVGELSGFAALGDQAGPGLYYVIGSFAQRANADDMAHQYAGFRPRIATARLDGRQLYRVTVGPFRHDALDDARRVLAQAGLFDAWAVRMDPASWVLARPPSAPVGDLAALSDKSH